MVEWWKTTQGSEHTVAQDVIRLAYLQEVMLCSVRNVSVGVVHQRQLPKAAAGKSIVKKADFRRPACGVRHSLRFLHFNIGSTPATYEVVNRAVEHTGQKCTTGR